MHLKLLKESFLGVLWMQRENQGVFCQTIAWYYDTVSSWISNALFIFLKNSKKLKSFEKLFKKFKYSPRTLSLRVVGHGIVFRQLSGGSWYIWLFGSFQTMGRLVGCVQSRGLSARVSRLPRFILLVSFSDTLLVVSISDIVMIGIWGHFFSPEGVKMHIHFFIDKVVSNTLPNIQSKGQ